MKPVLSILIPTVPQRSNPAERLIDRLSTISKNFPVEILYFGDNRTRTIGEKRQGLVDLSLGKYIAFVDDDDDVSDEYASKICDIGGREDVDVISFNQSAIWNDQKSIVEFSVVHPINGAWTPGGITKRFPWHSCAWRRTLAQRCHFPAKNWGEDQEWVMQIAPIARREARIPEVLHFYQHSDSTSLAV